MNNIIDELIRIGNKRSCDTLFYAEIPNHYTNEFLQDGFQLALNHFSKTKHIYQNQNWIHSDLPNRIEIVAGNTIDEFVEDWLNKHIDISQEHLIQQKIYQTPSNRYLLCKMNHVLADGVSMLMFLEAQIKRNFRESKLILKELPPKKNTPYKFLLPSQVPMDFNGFSDHRSFLYFKTRKFTNNEIIAGIFGALKALGVNRRSVWLPVNIRKSLASGFGNGISRMRIYDHENISIKQQKKDNYKNGELIGIPKIKKLNMIMKWLVLGFLNRPLIDYGSILLSHFDENKAGFNVLGEFNDIHGIINLHHRYSMSIYVHGCKEDHYTIVFDEKQIKLDTIKRFRDEFIKSLS